MSQISVTNITTTQTQIDTIEVGNQPRGIAVNTTKNLIYVANNGSDDVSVIDGLTNTVIETVDVSEGPFDVGVNPTTDRIYALSSNFGVVDVIDGSNNEVITSIDVGFFVTGIAVNPVTNIIYVASSSPGRVSVIDGSTDEVIETVALEIFPDGIAIDPATNRVYVSFIGDPGGVCVIDGSNNEVITTIEFENINPGQIGINPETTRIYVIRGALNSIVVIDGSSNEVIDTIDVGQNPFGVGVNPAINRIYVSNPQSNNVSVIDGASNEVIATVDILFPSGSFPSCIAVNPDTGRVYVSNSSNVTVIQDEAPAPAPSPVPSIQGTTVKVISQQKISDTQGNFNGLLDNNDLFGSSITSVGDLDRDGITDIVIGAPQDDDGGDNRGAVWVLFFNTDGTVKSHQKISNTQGNFNGVLDDLDDFGISVTSVGDLDGDGVTDIAVGAANDDDGGDNRGAVWVLFLNPDGTVKFQQKISDTQGNFNGVLGDFISNFGRSVASLGDLDGNGVTDIAVGSIENFDRSAVWIIFLDREIITINNALLKVSFDPNPVVASFVGGTAWTFVVSVREFNGLDV